VRRGWAGGYHAPLDRGKSEAGKAPLLGPVDPDPRFPASEIRSPAGRTGNGPHGYPVPRLRSPAPSTLRGTAPRGRIFLVAGGTPANSSRPRLRPRRHRHQERGVPAPHDVEHGRQAAPEAPTHCMPGVGIAPKDFEHGPQAARRSTHSLYAGSGTCSEGLRARPPGRAQKHPLVVCREWESNPQALSDRGF
jgi:hypothetical protein